MLTLKSYGCRMHFSKRIKLAAGLVAVAFVPTASSTPLSYGSYYEDPSSIACGYVNFCRLNFGSTPADKFVKLRHIHCNFNSSVPVGSASLSISATSGGSSLGRELPLQFFPSQPGTSAQSDGAYRYTVSMDTEFLIGQGRFPFLYFFTNASGFASMTCIITGESLSPV